MLKMRMIDDMPVEDIAEHFGVTPQAVYQAIKRVNKDAIAEIFSKGQSLIDKQVTVQGVLLGLMQDAGELLRDIKTVLDEDEWDRIGIEKRKLLLATSAEIRQQLSMYSDIQGKIFSVEAHQEFQQIVIDAIKEASPEVAEKITEKLKRRQPLRQFLGENRRDG